MQLRTVAAVSSPISRSAPPFEKSEQVSIVDASDSLFANLAPLGTLMRPEVALQLGASAEVSATMAEPLPGATGMMGYRVMPGSRGFLVSPWMRFEVNQR